MITDTLFVPRFHQGETVSFIGGTGIVKNHSLESGGWNYLVEMELGAESEFGRVGAETRLWLLEADLFPQEKLNIKELAVPQR